MHSLAMYVNRKNNPRGVGIARQESDRGCGVSPAAACAIEIREPIHFNAAFRCGHAAAGLTPQPRSDATQLRWTGSRF